ncbi:mediator of RNA polymerase II transcription subunit 15a-like isoform X2 [Vitis riparia]|uniref:mediator of RNA polymerase II transcription subunit 15a-like isoform X2 n=1 Tax=Vitis riparia TaxID=96939 RepID=UPI00155B3EA3|nr:mediator of RNA polymerase II transcription subunit 15a-like isoform X2 [Vitis riparia]
MAFPIGRAGVSLRLSSHSTCSQFQRPAQAELVMDGRDWETHLSRESRLRIVNSISNTLRRHLPVSGPEVLRQLWKIAERFEEKIYSAATSESDYLRKISLKMLAIKAAMKESHRSSMDMLKRHLPVSGPEELCESDYLRKIPLKVLAMETKCFNPVTNSLPFNSFAHRSRI